MSRKRDAVVASPADWIAASDLSGAWAGRGRFTLLDTAFHDGARCLAVSRAWLAARHADRDRDRDRDGDREHDGDGEIDGDGDGDGDSDSDGDSSSSSGSGSRDSDSGNSGNVNGNIGMHDEQHHPARCPARDIELAKAKPPSARLELISLTPTVPDVAPLAHAFVNPHEEWFTRQLRADWPPPTPDLHRLAFEAGALQWLILAGDARHRLPQLVARVDAIWLDPSTLAVDADPRWHQRLFKALARLAGVDACLLMPAGGDSERAALRAAGFVLTENGALPSFWHARYRPRFVPRIGPRRPTPIGPPVWPARTSGQSPAVVPTDGEERHALIIGAGLAGCATAWALAERGWRSTLLDRHAAPAREASGNPAGLFHGIVNANDGAHARFNRAAALEAGRAVAQAVNRHGVRGSAAGLLRCESTLPHAAMQALLADLRLPPGYVQALTAAEASARAGIVLVEPCWFYRGGGWVDPAGLARAFIERGGTRVAFQGGATVAAVRRSACGTRWRVLGADGGVIGESAVVVFADAGNASSGFGLPASLTATVQRVRGQLTRVPRRALADALPGLRLPALPIAGHGYLLPAVDGDALFGATAQPGDDDGGLRAADQAENIAALWRLTGQSPGRGWTVDRVPLGGRTAWRSVSADRLPLIGALPDPEASGAIGCDRLALYPRLSGLYTFSALGSRGITWAALGGQVLAALVSGSPVPLPAPLLDAIDPARFAVRATTRRRPVV